MASCLLAARPAEPAIENEQQIIAAAIRDRRRQVARPQLRHRLAEFGRQLIGAQPADIAPDRRARGLRELLRDGREPRALPHLLAISRSAKRRTSSSCAGLSTGEKDFGDPALRLVGIFLGALHRVIDFLVGNIDRLRRQTPHQLCPDDRRVQLIDQRAAIDAARFQKPGRAVRAACCSALRSAAAPC